MRCSRLVLLSLALVASGLPPAGADEASRLDARMETLSRPASAERLADYAHNVYQALLARGFGQEQAIRIVVAFASSATAGAACAPLGE